MQAAPASDAAVVAAIIGSNRPRRPTEHADILPADFPAFDEIFPLTEGKLRVLRVGDIQLNLDGYAVRVAGRPSHIRMQEFKILRLLMANAGRVVTRREILDSAWFPGFVDQHGVLTTHLVRVRRILNHGGYERLRTVRSIGYVIDAVPIDSGRD